MRELAEQVRAAGPRYYDAFARKMEFWLRIGKPARLLAEFNIVPRPWGTATLMRTPYLRDVEFQAIHDIGRPWETRDAFWQVLAVRRETPLSFPDCLAAVAQLKPEHRWPVLKIALRHPLLTADNVDAAGLTAAAMVLPPPVRGKMLRVLTRVAHENSLPGQFPFGKALALLYRLGVECGLPLVPGGGDDDTIEPSQPSVLLTANDRARLLCAVAGGLSQLDDASTESRESEHFDKLYRAVVTALIQQGGPAAMESLILLCANQLPVSTSLGDALDMVLRETRDRMPLRYMVNLLLALSESVSQGSLTLRPGRERQLRDRVASLPAAARPLLGAILVQGPWTPDDPVNEEPEPNPSLNALTRGDILSAEAHLEPSIRLELYIAVLRRMRSEQLDLRAGDPVTQAICDDILRMPPDSFASSERAVPLGIILAVSFVEPVGLYGLFRTMEPHLSSVDASALRSFTAALACSDLPDNLDSLLALISLPENYEHRISILRKLDWQGSNVEALGKWLSVIASLSPEDQAIETGHLLQRFTDLKRQARTVILAHLIRTKPELTDESVEAVMDGILFDSWEILHARTPRANVEPDIDLLDLFGDWTKTFQADGPQSRIIDRRRREFAYAMTNEPSGRKRKAPHQR